MSGIQKGRQSRNRWALTCANCRLRKTKCDGSQPSCKTCEVYDDQCRYDKAPSMTQVLEMSRKLREYEETIASFDQRPRETQSAVSDNPAGSLSPLQPANGLSAVDLSSADRTGGQPISDPSVSIEGEISYYGPTSAVHDPPSHSHSQPVTASTPYIVSKFGSGSGLDEARVLEQLTLENASVPMGLPPSVLSELLGLYWSWIAPMFLWVHKTAFMRDLGSGGKYCSQLLLNVLCAHSARFRGGGLGSLLIVRARQLLGAEIFQPSSIPKAQALLQLSARELALGSTSQAWLFSGMAFRMVSDLGLHHSARELAEINGLSPEDVEIRKRLFWSCYFWDKSISLYLGRMPVLVDIPWDEPPALLDDGSEDEQWKPFYCTSETFSSGLFSSSPYPPHKSHAISCFENSCKLSIIINDIITRLYSHRPSANSNEELRTLRARLDSWREETKSHLKYDAHNLPSVCPPPHIMTQNLLYFATIILLHRPFSATRMHRTICRQAAENMEKLILLVEKDFGSSHITYLMAYCIYTGVSGILQDVRDEDASAQRIMTTFLRVLQGGCTTCPVVQRSLDIINLNLKSPQARPAPEADSTAFATDEQAYLPAFPRQLPYSLNTQDAIPQDTSTEPFFWLDCFPENNFDVDMSGWYESAL